MREIKYSRPISQKHRRSEVMVRRIGAPLLALIAGACATPKIPRAVIDVFTQQPGYTPQPETVLRNFNAARSNQEITVSEEESAWRKTLGRTGSFTATVSLAAIPVASFITTQPWWLTVFGAASSYQFLPEITRQHVKTLECWFDPATQRAEERKAQEKREPDRDLQNIYQE